MKRFTFQSQQGLSAIRHENGGGFDSSVRSVKLDLSVTEPANSVPSRGSSQAVTP